MDRGGEEFQPWAREPGESALPVYHLRMLGAGMAGWQVLSLAGLWAGEPRSLWIPAVVSVCTTVIALTPLVWLTIRAEMRETLSRVDLWMLIVLFTNPLWPAVVSFLAHLLSDDIQVWSTRTGMLANIVCLGLVSWLLHALAPLVVAIRVFSRLGEHDDDWDSQSVGKSDRMNTVMAICPLFGGWACGLGGLSFWVGGVIDGAPILGGQGESDTLDLIIQAMEFGLLSQGLGLILGAVASIVIAPLLSTTRLDQALGPTFLPPVVVAVLASFFNPFAGIVLTGLTLLIAALISRRLFRWYPPGQCVGCGYSMSGLTTKVCPECGHDHASAGDSM